MSRAASLDGSPSVKQEFAKRKEKEIQVLQTVAEIKSIEIISSFLINKYLKKFLYFYPFKISIIINFATLGHQERLNRYMHVRTDAAMHAYDNYVGPNAQLEHSLLVFYLVVDYISEQNLIIYCRIFLLN